MAESEYFFHLVHLKSVLLFASLQIKFNWWFPLKEHVCSICILSYFGEICNFGNLDIWTMKILHDKYLFIPLTMLFCTFLPMNNFSRSKWAFIFCSDVHWKTFMAAAGFTVSLLFAIGCLEAILTPDTFMSIHKYFGIKKYSIYDVFFWSTIMLLNSLENSSNCWL